MALNKTILVKLKKKTETNPKLQEALMELLQFETSPKHGWFENTYTKIIEAACKEES